MNWSLIKVDIKKPLNMMLFESNYDLPPAPSLKGFRVRLIFLIPPKTALKSGRQRHVPGGVPAVLVPLPSRYPWHKDSGGGTGSRRVD